MSALSGDFTHLPHEVKSKNHDQWENLSNLANSAEMANFFQPLMLNILELFRKQYQSAEDNGHAVGDFILCGGPARNHWFAKTIFDQIQESQPGMTCAAEVL